MGRKSKRKANATPDETSRSDRKDILRVCGQIIDLAATQIPPTPAEQWEEYVQINSLVEKIRKKQHESHLQEIEREAHFEEFLGWLVEQGVQTDAFKLVQYEEGYGLQATRDIQMDEEVMCIPRKLMMTDQSALDSALGDLIKGDRLLKGMPNVSLAVFLISEKLKGNSSWQPYINILPSTFSIPLFYSSLELQMLQGSPAYSESLKQHKNIARQYAYLYKVLNQPDNSKLQIRDHFTYDLYRWAVATVMSRQNQIPTKDGLGVSLTLVPLWDMCNHSNGEMKTDYNRERDACINLALKDFSAGEQVYLCYGRRTNADLLLYSGFVHPENAYDGMTIQLGLSSGDRLYAMKAQLCAIMRLAVPSQNYNISNDDEPVSLELLTFLRIFCMTEEELKERLMGEERKQFLFKLVYKTQIVSKLNERRICVYLATRVTLLLRQYKTTIEEDEEKLKDDKLSHHERSVVQLLLAEKRILENVLNYCALWRERAEDLPEDATSYKPLLKEEEDIAEKWEDRDEEEEVEAEGKDERSEENGHGGESKVNGGDNEETDEDSHDDEKPKVNGDVISENGRGDTLPSKVDEDAKQVAGTGAQNKEGSTVTRDLKESVGTLKSKLNGSDVNGGHLITNGNGALTEGDDDGRTGGVSKNSGLLALNNNSGAMESKTEKPNGHIPIVPLDKSLEE